MPIVAGGALRRGRSQGSPLRRGTSLMPIVVGDGSHRGRSQGSPLRRGTSPIIVPQWIAMQTVQEPFTLVPERRPKSGRWSVYSSKNYEPLVPAPPSPCPSKNRRWKRATDAEKEVQSCPTDTPFEQEPGGSEEVMPFDDDALDGPPVDSFGPKDFLYIGEGLTADEFSAYVQGYDFGTIPPDFVVLHHTAIPSTLHARYPQGGVWDAGEEGMSEAQIKRRRKNRLDGIRDVDMGRPGWDRGPHLFVDDRYIWLFSPMREVGIHAKQGNGYREGGRLHYSIGIEVVGYYERVHWPRRSSGWSAMRWRCSSAGSAPSSCATRPKPAGSPRTATTTSRSAPARRSPKATTSRCSGAAGINSTPRPRRAPPAGPSQAPPARPRRAPPAPAKRSPSMRRSWGSRPVGWSRWWPLCRRACRPTRSTPRTSPRSWATIGPSRPPSAWTRSWRRPSASWKRAG